jgi:hypothetical protein
MSKEIDSNDLLGLGDKGREVASEKHDPVNHPAHFTGGGVECIDAIEAADYGPGFNRGNAIKYLWRAGKKDPAKELEDLQKAQWYLNREIERVRKAQG